MGFRQAIVIERAPAEVYEFMKEFENHPQERGSKVLRVERLTEGPVGLGARYLECVQLLPLASVEFISEVTRFEPPLRIVFQWVGGGMRGILSISIEAHNSGTLLAVEEEIIPQGILKHAKVILQAVFRQTWGKRLAGIKRVLESKPV